MLRLKGEPELEAKIKEALEELWVEPSLRKGPSLKKNQRKDFVPSVKELLSLPPENFLEEAYLKILQRPIDRAEKEAYLSKLLSGEYSKAELLAKLKLSSEGRKKRAKLKGLGLCILLYFIRKTPVLGRFLQPVEFILRLPHYLRRLKALENSLSHQLSLFQKEMAQLKRNFFLFEDKVKDRVNFLEELTKELKKEPVSEKLVEEAPYEALERALGQAPTFELLFRGSFEEIRERQSYYLEVLKAHLLAVSKLSSHLNLKEVPVLDVGCGRGEFLSLLREQGLRGIGLELREDLVSELRKKGFEVYKEEAVSFLERTELRFLALTAFQVVEHLEFDRLLRFLSLAYERLLEGGLLLLETVNPWNQEAFSRFYLDPTHRRPLPPELLSFLAYKTGFRNLKIIYSSPLRKEKRGFEQVKSLYLDYALLALK